MAAMVIQDISFFQVIQTLGIVVAIIASLYGIVRAGKVDKEKMATKDYVIDKVDASKKECMTKIKSLEDENNSQKDDLKYIRSRVDRLIDLHLKENKAS